MSSYILSVFGGITSLQEPKPELVWRLGVQTEPEPTSWRLTPNRNALLRGPRLSQGVEPHYLLPITMNWAHLRITWLVLLKRQFT